MKKYTVSEITRAIKGLLEQVFAGIVAVSGEVSSLSRSPAGHYYFVLKDQGAQIRCVFFRGYATAKDAFVPKNGDNVQVFGDLSVYESDGSYQLMVKKITYDSVGLFWQKFEATKRKLEEEGLFDDSRKRLIPPFPVRIALVTSPEGAAIKDFIITAKNASGRFAVELWPVPVQGVEAVPKIVDAVTRAGKMTGRYDALVLMRGGGSLEDLAVFNEEAVARALAGCAVPTISAIGHERDISICDFVADVREATPTAAATRLSRQFTTVERELNSMLRQIRQTGERKLHLVSQKLDTLFFRMKANAPAARLSELRQRVERLMERMGNTTSAKVTTARHAVERMESALLRQNPLVRVRQADERVEQLSARLTAAMQGVMKDRSQRLQMAMEKLRVLDPYDVVKRGYAIVKRNKKAITSVRDVRLEEELEISLKDGYIYGFVTGKKVEEESENGKNSDY